jgi:arylsulfatase A-like enzyme/predicted Zn-dependent protease
LKNIPESVILKLRRRTMRIPGRRTALIAGVLTVGVCLWLVLRPEKDPAGRIRRLWSKRGVKTPNVLLITLDTTRADHIACYGYPDVKTPNLDALAGRGVLFEQAATSSPLTLPAHCSIMTGMYPTYHGVRVNGNTALSQEQTTIAEVLSARGYRCGAFIGAFVLDGRWGLNQGFQYYDDQFDLRKYKHLDLGEVQRPGSEVMDAALAWLDSEKADPFFAWIHLYDPHAPYEPPEPYYSEYAGRGRVGLYDGEIASMDDQIGRCVAWLEKNGLADETIIVLIGDHGEGLGSHGEGTHGYFIYDYAAHVPFIITTPLPGTQGVRVPSQVRAVDVFPTVLGLLGLEGRAGVHGRSVVPLMFRPNARREEPAYAESMAPNIQFGWSPLQSLRTTRYKYIDAPNAELYDISRDTGERDNLLKERPDIARSMKAALDRLTAETSRGAPLPQAADLDRETVERLAALGYVGAPVGARRTSGGGPKTLADPKDKLPVFMSIQEAGELIMQNKYAPAAERLEAALREEPTIPQALLQLATCYTELGRTEEAKVKLDAVLKDDPENVQALISVANLLLREGKKEDVLALCKRTLVVDERNVQAYMLMGEVYMSEQNHAEALPYLEKAAEIQPKLTRNRLNLAAALVGVKQYARAETMLKDLIREFPRSPRARYNLGLLYEEQGRREEAKAAYTEEVAAFPREYQARFNLGKVLLSLGDRGGYLENMREVVRLAPQRAEGYLFLARGLLLEEAPLDEAQTAVEKGLGLADTSDLKAFGYFLLADIYNRRHQPEMMQDALRKANSFKPIRE